MTGTIHSSTNGAAQAERTVPAPFFLRGTLVESDAQRHSSRDLGVSFAVPDLDLDMAVVPRSEVPPLLDVPLTEIIAFLVETGKRIRDPGNDVMRECIDRMCSTHILPPEVVAQQAYYASLQLDEQRLWAEVQQNFPDPAALDGWVPKQDYTGRKSLVRAFGPRLLHVMPGNSPGVAVKSIAHGAMVKAVNLFKMASSDPFTTVAILRTMAEIDATHPIVRSMSAAYWRGGDENVERILYRPQYFDKIVAWGGGDAINNVIKYLGPGLQLVSFDPKTSISMVGKEAFVSPETTAHAARLAAADVMTLNQEACVASRYQFVEGSQDQVDEFCEHLHAEIVRLAAASGDIRPLDSAMKEEIEMMVLMGDDQRVWGRTDGTGVVIRSSEPVDFHPINKTANVVMVGSLDDALRHVNVATQTVGFFPFARMAEYRDRLASRGAQRIVQLGEAGPSTVGSPHDAMYPLHRFVNWIVHEDGVASG